MIKIILTIVGIISTIIGIIKGFIEIRENLKFKISKNTTIFLLIGIILILLGVLVFDRLTCSQNPEIKIKEPLNNSAVENYIIIEGKAYCFQSNYKVALLIHRKSQLNNLDGWFINSECASIDNNRNWRLTNVEIGTENTKGYKFEIYAYAIPDSICLQISKIVSDSKYQGFVTKPPIIHGVFDMVEIYRK